MGVSFAVAAATRPTKMLDVALQTRTIMTPICANVLAILVCIVFGCFICKYRVPRFFGLLLIGIFAIHIPFVVYFGLYSDGQLSD
jgi:heme A synthase